VAYGAFECKFNPDLELAFAKVVDKVADLLGQGLDKIGLGFLNNLFGDEESLSLTGGVPTEVLLDLQEKAREEKDCFSAVVKRELLKAAVKDVLEFARSEDRTRFIQNYGDELKHAADGALAEVASEALGANICRPFRNLFEVIVERSLYPDRSLRAPRFSCTISEAIDAQEAALRRFSDDFRNGGWDRWVELHRSSNNELGFYLAVNDLAILKRSEAEEAKKLEVQTSDGMKNEEHCVAAIFIYVDGVIQEEDPLTPSIKIADWNDWRDNELARDPSIDNIKCSEKDIITPASVIASQINKAVSAETDNLIESDSFYEIMKEIMSIAVSDILRNGL
jgi:hypothetical protein